MNIKCFFLEPTGVSRRTLRRFVFSTTAHGSCPSPVNFGYHNAQGAVIDTVPTGGPDDLSSWDWPRDDVRWPKRCDCGYEFRDADEWQVFTEPTYRRQDSAEIMTLREAPVGAMWFAPFYDQITRPQLAHALVVKTPGGDWVVDSQASNCTIPEDRLQERHHCWVISGELPAITAGKNGKTCAAGAGSIQAGSYHGFLRDGYLVPA